MSITSKPTADLPPIPSQRPPGKVVTRLRGDFAAFLLRPQTPHPRGRPFTDSEVATIFASPSYERWATDPLLFWASLLGLCMGLRASEVLRLSIGDIVEQHGVTCIVAWDRAAKRAEDLNASRRRSRWMRPTWSIPMPQVLLDAGFLDYVAAINEKKGKQLFPAIQRKPARDIAASLKSKFTRYVRSRGIKDGGFPALRQTFEQRIKRADIDGIHRKVLTRESERHFPVLKHFYPPLYRMDRFKKSLDKSYPGALALPRFVGR
ncbi:integrase [Xanthomonas translucens]|uniref:integrase n=1 Tax=Xanthomonas campestris pv. translucens TaxID=343 RepID=UPI0012D87746|nr:integrase [Xanthomonas translucens]